MINKRLYSNIALSILSILVLSFPIYLLIKTKSSFNNTSTEAEFVGRETCKECHTKEYADYIGSHHDKAMEEANDSTVLGNFNNQELISKGLTHRMYKRNGLFYVFTDGDDGQMKEFEIKYTFGFTPLQQYLVEFDKGRLQTLALTWNTLEKKWYHMADEIYKNQIVNHNNWLHWTNQAQNWNSMCADCHSTNLVKGYDLEKDEYHTTYSEIDVSCEACHGPGSEHMKWSKQQNNPTDKKNNYGLIVKTSGINNKQYVDNCVRCHSRRTALTDFTHASTSIYDHVIPNLPDEPNWHIDGQIKEEDYVYGSFTQSKMYMKDVQCNDCHNVHSGKLLYTDNRLCLQCHQSETYDTPKHHFHKEKGSQGEAVISDSNIRFEVGSGTECINCHMHGQLYMGVDYRRDHSFRIPRPDLSITNGTPNACTQCHAQKSNQWAAEKVESWFGKSKRFQYGEAFYAAKNKNNAAINQLKNISNNELYPPTIRALAIQNLGNFFPNSITTDIDGYLGNANPTLRLAAAMTMQINSVEDLNKLLPLLKDETKAIRIESVRILSTLNKDLIPSEYKANYDKAYLEYFEVLRYNADFPIGKFNLANAYYNKADYTNSEKYYLLTLEQDKELTFVKLNLAYLYNRIGKNEKAELLFKEYININQTDGQAYYSYGLLLSELKKYDQALENLIKASQLLPNQPRINHNIAMLYDFKNDKLGAEEHLKKEIIIANTYDNSYELLKFYIQNKQNQKAKTLAKQLTNDYPNNIELQNALKVLNQ